MAITVRIEASGIGVALPDQVARATNAAPAAINAGMAKLKDGMLAAMRAEIATAFPASRRLPTTITGTAYPIGETGAPATVWVYPRKGANIAGLLRGHRGATVAPRGGQYLAIPLPSVPRQGRRQMTPDEFRARFGAASLSFVPARGGRAAGYLVSRTGKGRDRFLFVLVRTVTLPPRLRPEVIAESWAARAPELIADAGRELGLDA